MYHAARPERKKAVGGMLFSLALTAFLTGVTEPIEFTFMFLAPVLYAVHAVLTGLSMVVMERLESHLGFTFSAGLFDYVLNYGRASRPWVLIPVGLVYGVVYYGLFRFFIRVFNLKTPGREDEGDTAVEGAPVAAGGRAEGFVVALGGAGNLKSVSACTTRLRLVIGARDRVDEPALKRLGARGVIAPSPTDLQVVLGPTADAVADEIKAWLARGDGATVPAGALDMAGVVRALGGRGNVAEAAVRAGRVCLRLIEPGRVDQAALSASGLRGSVMTGDDTLQLLAGGEADRLAATLKS